MTDTVLIVDDSLTVRMDLQEAFEDAGLRTVVCATAAAAREAFADAAADVIVLDVLLPDGDGVELLKELRASADTHAAVVLMLSTEAELKDRLRGLRTGADEYVGKPYDAHYVVARARELLRERRAEATTGRTTILIIDDSITFREALRQALEEAGYVVLMAGSGEEGLRAAAATRPGAIVVDSVLPGLDGAAVIRRLRLDAALRSVPCLLLTGSEDRDAELRAFEAGADAFVRKEEDMEVILARLAATLRSATTSLPDKTTSLLGPKRILAVDDSATYLAEVATMLRDEGYDVVPARSGEEALELLAVQAMDCILLDLLMPGLSGRETCQRIKAAPIVRDIPLIMLTGLEDRGAMLDALEAGADDYIQKSSEFEVLKARVRAQLRRKQFEDDNRRIRGELHNMELEAAEARAAQALAAELRRSRDELELQVRMRTAELTQTMRDLQAEIAERKLAQTRLQAQLERLTLLDQITRAIGERQDLQSIYQVAIRSVEERLPVDFGCVCRYNAVDHALTVISVGAHSQALAMELAIDEQSHIAIDQNGLSRAVRGELVYEADTQAVPFPFPQWLARGGLRSLVVAPLQSESRVFGVLVAARRLPQSFSSGDCEFLRQLSTHVALAAQQAELHGALQQAYDDLHQTQQTVMQQERLRALGQMASGIAHDINNALSPVALYTASLLEREPGLSDRGRGQLVTIARAIDDVAATVARMREFYRQREPQLPPTPVQLNLLAQQVLDFTHARWSDMPQQRGIVIRLETELAPDLPAILGVEGEVREALINLVFNAVDAMPDGGVLTLRTRGIALREGGSSAAAAIDGHDGRSAVVEVSDTGLGMDEDTRRRCLEPFFTTKGERGTGLGLAMVYGVTQRHGAEIEIDSAPGRGTTVRLSFPIPAIEPAAPVAALPQVPASRLRILIIDDDPMMLKSLCDALELDGHVVVTADGGQAGIDAFLAVQRPGEAFDVVITDLGMPYVDGRKVAVAVKASANTAPVILLTGWGQRLVADGDVPEHVDRVLSKPPKLREVRAALAQLTLTAPAGSSTTA